MARKKVGERSARSGGEAREASMRTARAAQSAESFPLKLTEQQRSSVLQCTRLKRAITALLQSAGEGTQVVRLARKELDDLDEELFQAAEYIPHPHKARLVAVLRKVNELLACDSPDGSSEAARPTFKTASKRGDLRYQFRISLRDVRPSVWRRIQVPDCTLADFHDFIQGAMGWRHAHLHEFVIDGTRYGPMPEDDFLDYGDGIEDEETVRLGALIPKSAKRLRWRYDYDFGDNWRHDIVFEGFCARAAKVKYPLCLDGARACPPEDCGGPWGYADMLDAVRGRKHERHDEMLEWLGEFDPEQFDAEAATRAMRDYA